MGNLNVDQMRFERKYQRDETIKTNRWKKTKTEGRKINILKTVPGTCVLIPYRICCVFVMAS